MYGLDPERAPRLLMRLYENRFGADLLPIGDGGGQLDPIGWLKRVYP